MTGRRIRAGAAADGGRVQASEESLEVAFLTPNQVGRWHTDHHERLLAAMAVAG